MRDKNLSQKQLNQVNSIYHQFMKYNRKGVQLYYPILANKGKYNQYKELVFKVLF
jgi:hypothetical protein